MSIISSANLIGSLKRKCPKCGKEQMVPASKAGQSAACKFCGAAIPPKR